MLYALTERDSFSRYFESRFRHLECEVQDDELHVLARDRLGGGSIGRWYPAQHPPMPVWCPAPDQPRRLRWNSAPGQRYRMLSASNLLGPWEMLQTMESSEYQTFWTPPFPEPTSPAAFFRLLWPKDPPD